jgi:hypothetical protein
LPKEILMMVLAQTYFPDNSVNALKYGAIAAVLFIAVVLVAAYSSKSAKLGWPGVVLGAIGLVSMAAVALIVQITPKPADPNSLDRNTLVTVCDLLRTKLIIADKGDSNALAVAEQMRLAINKRVSCPKQHHK